MNCPRVDPRDGACAGKALPRREDMPQAAIVTRVCPPPEPAIPILRPCSPQRRNERWPRAPRAQEVESVESASEFGARPHLSPPTRFRFLTSMEPTTPNLRAVQTLARSARADFLSSRILSNPERVQTPCQCAAISILSRALGANGDREHLLQRNRQPRLWARIRGGCRPRPGAPAAKLGSPSSRHPKNLHLDNTAHAVICVREGCRSECASTGLLWPVPAEQTLGD